MFTRLTNTSWIIKGVLVVAAVALFVPVYIAYGQGAENQDQGPVITPPFTETDLDLGSGFAPSPFMPQGENQDQSSSGFTSSDPQGQAGGATVVTPGGGSGITSGIENSRTTVDAAEEVAVDEAFAESPLTRFIYVLVVNTFGWFTFAGGYLLDLAVNNFVINFGLEFNTRGVGQSVNELWSLVRDFFNILFIFGFIWIGFQMILDSGNSRAKQTLVSLIMAALLVNFSLFISKFVVDFSNRLATEVAIAAFPLLEDGRPITDAREVSISDTFFAHLGVSETLNVPAGVSNGDREPWAFIFGSAIFYLVAGFVFAAGGIMLIIRFVALSIFMVLSPFMFLGWVFPGMQGWTNKYWTGFLGRAFYAPVYIILLFFAGTILQRMFGEDGSSEIIGGTGGLLSAVSTNEDNLILVLGPFVLSAAFMLAAVIVAGKMSADGAGGVMKVGNSLQRGGRRFVARKTVGLGAYGVSTIGRSAGKAVERFDAASQATGGRRVARGILNTATLGLTSNSALKAATGAMAGASVAGSLTREQYLKQERERSQVNSRIRTKAQDESAIKAAEGIDPNNPNLTDEQKALLDKREAAINNYSTAELEEMGEEKRNKLVGMLKAGTVSKLLDSDKLTPEEKNKLQAKYTDIIKDKVLDANREVITEELTKLSDKQLEILGNDFAQTYAGSFSDKQMEGYMKSDAFTERQKGSQKAARTKSQKDQTQFPNTRKTLFRQTEVKIVDGKRTAVVKDKPKKATELAALPYEAFVSGGKLHGDAVEYLTVDTLKQMARNARQGNPAPNDAQRQELALELMNSPILDIRVANYLQSKTGMEDFEITQDMINMKQRGGWSDPSI